MKRFVLLLSLPLAGILAILGVLVLPAGGAVPEVVFPRNVLVMADAPERACADFSPAPPANCAAFRDYDRSDYKGGSNQNGVNERMEFVPDPAGSDNVVLRMDVFGTDVADQYGGTRTSIYKKGVNCHGCESWNAFGVFIPVGFVYPDTWMLLYQMFSSGGNPAQALELRTSPFGGIRRDYLWWKNQQATTSNRTYAPLGPVQEGHWHYFVQRARYSSTDGFNTVWHSVDHLPDVTLPPKVNFVGKTLYTTAAGADHMFMYRDPGPVSQHQTVYFCGFHRAATAAGAMDLSNSGAPGVATLPRTRRCGHLYKS
jgi:hypothetical protein